MARKVKVVPYDPAWQKIYQGEASHLQPLLGENLVTLHHIGYTPAPGLAAKPTIDILAVVHCLTRFTDHPMQYTAGKSGFIRAADRRAAQPGSPALQSED